MNQRDINFYDGCIKDWAIWELAGRATPGLFQTSIWSDGRPPKDSTRLLLRPSRDERRKLGVLPTSPKETRRQAHSKPLTAKVDTRSELVRSVIVRLEEESQMVVWCIYLKKMSYNQISRQYCVPSRYIGDTRYGVLKAISNVL